MPGAVWKSDSSVWELKKDGNGEHLIKAGTVLGSVTTLCFTVCVPRAGTEEQENKTVNEPADVPVSNYLNV